MAMLAVLIPLLMLGVVLVLGRYEEVLLPQENADRREPAGVPVAPASAAAAPSPAPAGTAAPSP
ncbi:MULTISPECIES: hypothetical protein [Streptomyces]|uniref:Secreted protein n=1 Tax=Streptomyces violaceus TaxID=1936 RepID=A0ABY9U462_STRVL|nr:MULTISPECIES: hypothetical protein [Streptomyces]MCT9144741.1 hypothetical protein [Streptomyces violarus]WND17134.1 hypothetical protein RI060_07105 [Streptomyces janthinus]WNF66157.1 hypothetical protein RJD14_27800 [Streptomyces sp. CGMCC 4.1456]GGS40325.1 hypothetical protein GCM10010270_07510 [Streptomyces janthinus]